MADEDDQSDAAGAERAFEGGLRGNAQSYFRFRCNRTSECARGASCRSRSDQLTNFTCSITS